MSDLTTWSNVQTVLELDASVQAEAERLISVASRRCEDYCGRVLSAETVTRQLDGSGRRLLDVGDYPIRSVTSVHVDSDRAFGASTEVTDYIIRDAGYLYRDTPWPRGVANVRVVAEVGYQTVPADLEESIIQLVGYWIDTPRVSWLEGGADEGDYQARYTGVMDVPFPVRILWDNYRRHRSG
jgi:hypothetical protein